VLLELEKFKMKQSKEDSKPSSQDIF